MKILEIDNFLLPPGAARCADEATAKSGAGPGFILRKAESPPNFRCRPRHDKRDRACQIASSVGY
jgi:hypothetical protein